MSRVVIPSWRAWIDRPQHIVKIVVKDEKQPRGCRGQLLGGATILAETRLFHSGARDQAYAEAEAIALRHGWHIINT